MIRCVNKAAMNKAAKVREQYASIVRTMEHAMVRKQRVWGKDNQRLAFKCIPCRSPPGEMSASQCTPCLTQRLRSRSGLSQVTQVRIAMHPIQIRRVPTCFSHTARVPPCFSHTARVIPALPPALHASFSDASCALASAASALPLFKAPGRLHKPHTMRFTPRGESPPRG